MSPEANKTTKTTKVAKTATSAKIAKMDKTAMVTKPGTIVKAAKPDKAAKTAKPANIAKAAKTAKTNVTKVKRLSAGQRIYERRMKQAARQEGTIYHSLIVHRAPAKKAEKAPTPAQHAPAGE